MSDVPKSRGPGDPSADRPTIGALYRAAQASFVEFAESLDADDWRVPVPCTPGWDVRDVLSHVAGVPDDALAGRLDGVAGEAWTAAQVERNRSLDVAELLARWSAQTPPFADALDAIDEQRPPFDCHTHEHDVRHALGRPGNRASAIVERGGAELGTRLDASVPVAIELTDGRSFTSPGSRAGDDHADGVTLRGMTAFEIFRSRLGRRSRDQVGRYEWDVEPERVDELLDAWFVFGPSPTAIVE